MRGGQAASLCGPRHSHLLHAPAICTANTSHTARTIDPARTARTIDPARTARTIHPARTARTIDPARTAEAAHPARTARTACTARLIHTRPHRPRSPHRPCRVPRGGVDRVGAVPRVVAVGGRCPVGSPLGEASLRGGELMEEACKGFLLKIALHHVG
ncbi:DUF4573 domain-containing protein [Streptomyces palmae]|uniref:DUF4573 domain-containing protein n=1 Tax=Streptomyces palmae TaxID=1701085 RepID=UPI0035E9B911